MTPSGEDEVENGRGEEKAVSLCPPPPSIDTTGTDQTKRSESASPATTRTTEDEEVESSPSSSLNACSRRLDEYWQRDAEVERGVGDKDGRWRGSTLCGSEQEWNDDDAAKNVPGAPGGVGPPRLPTPTTLEGLRVQSDLRQIGSLLVALGIGAYVSSFMLQAELIEGGMPTESVEGVKLAQLTATTLQTVMGLFATAVGFVAMTVTPINSRKFHLVAKWLVAVINGAGPVGLIITIVRVAQGACVPPEQNQFIPHSFEPTETDVRFVAAMGILGISSVCSTLIGGLTVMSLNLCAYLGCQPVDKNRGYYIVRFGYYNVIVFLGGVSQLALGIYLLLRYGGGFYDDAIRITVYAVHSPEMAVVAGAVQTIVPVYGWSRAAGWLPRGDVDDHSFLYASAFLWVTTTVFQIVIQPAYAMGRGALTAVGATYSAVYLGTFIMPPYLDYLVRNTPVRIPPEYFGLSSAQVEERVDPLCRCFGLTSERMLAKERL
eukprot:CAMPEP_0113568128 /NCGR_PEP_ID=MMETSP0015_2-20120614/23671_1 /TAXON_ID=2838 /ORGANISM="Odontella" /LENGTH=489 /DNA_ID=CAMNT_0000470623 /DNA_START=293 /DNA_END=1759 /DNA_ORIENTATION=- /assembly_acc=CAM_ASM_000160